jgi:hypothetical protein
MKGTIMGQTEKIIVTAFAASFTTTLTVIAVVLKTKSRKLGKRIELQKEILNILEKAKTASTEEDTDKLLADALARLDKLDSEIFKKTFNKWI